MTEINGQTFEEGDTVHFERASLPGNRDRDYRITAANPGGIEVSPGDFAYRLTADEAARIGITHAEK